jgi:pilus assembly protein CpaE
MSEKSRVLLVEVFPKVAQKINALLERIDSIELIPNNISNSEMALDTIRQIKPDIVLLELELPGLNGIQCTDIIKRDNSQIQVIILSEVSSADTVRQAMRAGAVDFLNYNTLTLDELISVIQRADSITQQEKKRQQTIQRQTKDVSDNGKKPLKSEGKLITVYSPKGGAGVSTVVANLGYVFKESSPNARVLLMDMDMQYGDIAILYNQIPNRSIMDLAVRIQNIDDDLVNSVVFTDNASGLDLLAPPQKLDLANEISGGTITKIIAHLRTMYDLIIVNADSYLTESELVCMSSSDLILLIAIQHVATIRSLRATIQLLSEHAIGKDKLAIILNRFNETSSITPRKIGEILSLTVSQVIINDAKTSEKAANLGIPFTIDNKKAEISRSFNNLLTLVRNRLLAKEKSEV